MRHLKLSFCHQKGSSKRPAVRYFRDLSVSINGLWWSDPDLVGSTAQQPVQESPGQALGIALLMQHRKLDAVAADVRFLVSTISDTPAPGPMRV